MDKEKELLSVSFSGHLPLGEGHLKISYTGEVASNLKGFFRSQYKGSQGEDRFHYLTKFEPTFARYHVLHKFKFYKSTLKLTGNEGIKYTLFDSFFKILDAVFHAGTSKLQFHFKDTTIRKNPISPLRTKYFHVAFLVFVFYIYTDQVSKLLTT